MNASRVWGGVRVLPPNGVGCGKHLTRLRSSVMGGSVLEDGVRKVRPTLLPNCELTTIEMLLQMRCFVDKKLYH